MADSRTSLIFINSLIAMAPQLLEARRAGRCRRKGWAAAGPQRPAYSGLGHIVSPRAQLVFDYKRAPQSSQLQRDPLDGSRTTP